MKLLILKVISGGQTGVDRAALDAAINNHVDYGGWCPKGGWAEDFQIQPGILTQYPKLMETPTSDPDQRTNWNVRDSSATLILICNGSLKLSKGTHLTHSIAIKLGKPVLTINIFTHNSLLLIQEWIVSLDNELILNVAGPRESEIPGIYIAAKEIISDVLVQSI
jgi:Circularly permutated YpsA SLOG family